MSQAENEKVIAIAGEWWTQRLILAGISAAYARNIANSIERYLSHYQVGGTREVILDDTREGVLFQALMENGFDPKIIPSDIRMKVQLSLLSSEEKTASVSVLVTIYGNPR